MEKKDIRVSDAIPQRPASFDDAVERTLARVVKKEQKEQQKETPARIWKTENVSKRKRGSGRGVLDIVAIALIFVICVGAIGAVIGARLRLFRTAPAADGVSEQPTVHVSTTRTVHVSTVDELLAALAPDTEIVLADGTYDLTTAADYGMDQVGYYTWVDRSDNWFREKEENSFELEIRNLENVRIVGSRNAEIVTVPRTAAVLSVQSCTGLELSGFTAGHTVMADPCEGEVIRAVECADLWVENCSLYGCGTWGVSATDCNNLKVVGCDIHECSSGGLSLVRCRNTRVTECTVRDCGYRDEAFSIFYIFDCADLTISNCDVYGSQTETVFKLYNDWEEPASERIFLLGTSVHDNTVSEYAIYNTPEGCIIVDGCEFRNNSGALLPEDQFVFDRDGNRLYEADLLAMQLDRTGDAAFDALPTPPPKPSEESTSEPVIDPAFDGLCLFFDTDLYYAPFENWIWSDQDDGIAADGMTFLWKMEEVRDKIPTIYNPGMLTVKAGDGVQLEPQLNIYDAELNTVAFGADISTVCTLDPGTYYVSQRVSRREEGKTSGYECIVRIVISESNPVPEETPAPAEGPNKLLIPAIMYDEDLYVMHDELRPDAPDASAVKEVVTSLTHITQWPQKSGQANFGEIGTAFYVTLDGLVVYYNDEWRLFVPEEPGDDPDKVLWNDPNAFPGLFRFWDYDEENGYSEAPEEGVLFVCDFDGDGTEDEIAYKIHGQYLTISLGKKSVEVSFGAGLEQAILLDLDPDSTRLNLLIVYNTGSEDYETAELHMENGRFVRGPVIFAYCSCDGDTVRGSATQTDILGTRLGGRTYHGEELTPDSEWFDCDVIPDEIPSASDRARLIEGGKLLHLVRDLPCTIDGADALIPAGSYIYMTRWHESGTLAEIRTEDGTTALLTVERADPLDPELYGYLIDGVTQDTYFDNIFYAD